MNYLNYSVKKQLRTEIENTKQHLLDELNLNMKNKEENNDNKKLFMTVMAYVQV